MVNKMRRGVVIWLAAIGLLCLAGGARAAVIKPIVLVFASGARSGANIEAKRGGDTLSLGERTTLAARAVRNCLNDSGAVTAMVYLPDAPMYVRAARENNLVLASRDEPTEGERVALGKAVGAVYVLAVTARAPLDGSGGIEITLAGNEVLGKKTWADKTRTADQTETRPSVRPDNNALPSTGAGLTDNVLLSAANTLSARLLAGPLGDYSRTAAPPALLPPTVNRAGIAEPVLAPALAAPVAAPVVAAPVAPAPVVPVAAAPPPATVVAPVPTPPAAVTAPPADPVKSDPVKSDPAVQPAAPPASSPAETAEVTDENALAALQQAEALLTSGDPSAAVGLLRRAVNQSPLSLRVRIALARAYLAARRGTDAADEARRALRVAPTGDRASLMELSQIMAQAYAQNGDTTAARVAYEEIIRAQPTAQWARVALADLLLQQNRTGEAEAILRGVQKVEPTNREAAIGMARLLASRGDYAGATRELNVLDNAPAATGTPASGAASEAIATLFDEGAPRLANLMTQNRAAWEANKLSREVFFKATTAQSERAGGLQKLLKAVPPPPGSPDATVKAYRKRVYAASLLSQAASALLGFLETGDPDTGTQAALQLTEFQKELQAAQALAAGKAP